MKDLIEERAHQYGIKRAGGCYAEGTKGMIYEGSKSQYIEIATEQHEITKKETTDKLCEWLKHHWRDYVGVDSDGVVRFGGWENDFRKVVE